MLSLCGKLPAWFEVNQSLNVSAKWKSRWWNCRCGSKVSYRLLQYIVDFDKHANDWMLQASADFAWAGFLHGCWGTIVQVPCWSAGLSTCKISFCSPKEPEFVVLLGTRQKWVPKGLRWKCCVILACSLLRLFAIFDLQAIFWSPRRAVQLKNDSCRVCFQSKFTAKVSI